jgi:hypothetical protein
MQQYIMSIIFLLFLSCMQSPTELLFSTKPDCAHATIPKSYKPDSTKTYVSVEIFDFQLKSIIQNEWNDFSTGNNTPNINEAANLIGWNGIDSDGKIAEPGKYLMKVSMLSNTDTSCLCKELILRR